MSTQRNQMANKYTKLQGSDKVEKPASSYLYIHAIFCVLLIIIWFGLFGICLFYDTEAIRTKLASDDPFSFSWTDLGEAIWGFINWSIPNIGIIACLTSLLGAAAHFTDFLIDESKSDIKINSNFIRYYTGALIRGFIIYLLFLAGLLVFNEGLFQPTANFPVIEYIRLVAVVSLLSFLVGFRGDVLKGIIEQLKSKVE